MFCKFPKTFVAFEILNVSQISQNIAN